MNKRALQVLGGAFTVSALMLAPTAVAAPPPGGCGPNSGNPACQTNGVSAILVGGNGSYATLTEEQMSTAFGGYFANYDQRISAPFPGEAEFNLSIPEGAENLYNAIYAQPAGTVITIGGVSKGAPSVIYALKRIEADRANLNDGLEPPDVKHMNVMIYGAPSRPFYTGTKYRPDLPVTPYNVVIVAAEYDGIADMPDNLFNILAVLNAIQGAESLHVDAAFNTDFENDPMHYKVETNKAGGKVTTVIIPFKGDILPLFNPMLAKGADPAMLVKMSAFLKPMIDSGYKRNNYFEKKKWVDGIADIPLPEAAPKPAKPVADPINPDPSGPKLLSNDDEDYKGKHRLKDDEEKDVVKQLKAEAKEEVKEQAKEEAKEDESDTRTTSVADEQGDEGVTTPEAQAEASDPPGDVD